MSKFAVAGIQMHIGMQDNIPEMRKRLGILMHLYPWVEMVIYSELAATGPAHHAAQPAGGSIEQAFCAMARDYGVWLLPGSYFEARGGRVYNTAPVIDPSGTVIARYSKMFPFAPYEAGVEPGTEPCVFDVPGAGRFGLSICYDIWFPELTRQLVSMGAEAIVNPVMASFVDRHADIQIATATAPMFQCYVFAVNGLLAGGNGYSRVIDPAGRILHDGCVQEEMFPLEIDFDAVRRQRRRGILNMGQPLKSFRDCGHRFEVYRDGFRSDYLDALGPLEKPGRIPR
ncbi:carbon-nitrogen hydrolase family protein [Mangrovicoccus sp. HB161399]|uniref:carbon-nitrogen hydrolase family protein n=1 Tax=Mangrovicoccus sp. HB161399 TaxID=2720392 RepID=UPI0015550131|nr:carbon-nitrogen hydrolase family protein [Mangrovicoccus sp. HB161399]